MIERIYHGSVHRIEQPVYGAGKPYNDYGLGFYCTKELDMAREWAVGHDRSGYANAYDIDCEGLDVLDLGGENCDVLAWLAVLLENREFDAPSALAQEAKEYLLEHFRPDYQQRDVIIGYRADDSYFSFAQDFINGTISLRQLEHAMYLGKLGLQFVVKSRRAFQRLTFVEAVHADASAWYPRKLARDRAARRECFDVERNRRQRGDLFIAQIIDEEMVPGDPRLR